jgi:SAM-dependent methyltransferase
MHANAHALSSTSGEPSPDTSHVFPWSLGEVRASLAVCPPGAFHLTGLRLERLGPESWWGDLVGYRDDLGAPFVWPGFRIRRGRGWEVALPPYLVDVDGVWRALISSTMQRLVVAALADATLVRSEALFVTIERPGGLPTLGNIGGERVTPAEPSTGAWLRRAKRYRLAAALTRNRTVLVLGAGPGARMLARQARRVVAVDTSREAVEYGARVYRSSRVTFASALPGALPFAAASFDIVVALDGPVPDASLLAEIDRVLRADGMLVAGTDDLAAASRLTALLRERFAGAQAWSQQRALGRAEILDEFELRPVVDPDAAAFVLMARRQPGMATPRPQPAPPALQQQDRLRRGLELLTTNQLVEAFAEFAAILRVEPTSVAALVGAAHCALAVDDTATARELLRRVLAVEPEHAGARAALHELDAASVGVNA